MWTFEQMIRSFADRESGKLLRAATWGLEKESQRVTPSGELAMTDHPAAFGDKLANREITTDFAESQLELVTPPLPSIEETHAALRRLHDRVDAVIGQELMWPLSMPPRLPEEERIPIAKFDDSPEGRISRIYRQSLALRYGKKMQMISGLHVNVSLADTLLAKLHETWGKGKDRRQWSDEVYFAMARNVLRYRWVLVYLFGASPTADESFNKVPDAYKLYATSLRASRFGYTNEEQGNFVVSFNSLEEYTDDLNRLLATRNERFSQLGIYRNGEQVQLNDHWLQMDREFYSPIRMKRTAAKGKADLEALRDKGVEYVELRILDLNPYERTGVSLEQLYLVHLFLLTCLFESSPALTEAERAETNDNQARVALFGRKPGLTLARSGQEVDLDRWLAEWFDKMEQVAACLDQAGCGIRYLELVERERAKVGNRDLLPSSVMQQDMRDRGETFVQFGLRRAIVHRQEALARR